MLQILDLLKNYLHTIILILSNPINSFCEILMSDARLKDCFNIALLFCFIGLSVGYSISTDGSFQVQLLFLLVIPLLLYILAIKISWVVVNSKVSMDIIICQSLIFIGLNCLIMSIGYSFGMFALRIYNLPLYNFIMNNNAFTISYSLLHHADVWERNFISNNGLKYFILFCYLSIFICFIYWILISVGVAKRIGLKWWRGFIS
ncbi:hypothetical protein, partial [Chimaeribacter coloradensis]|uniref:hypothetical protein n=1 Tax=Chimaeribacter coloradensis TaxID=2060068 RepID=UPI0019D4B47D